LKSAGFSGYNEPLGIQARGLAYSPQNLLQLGYSIIYSVKNDLQHSESEVRQFFRAKRTM
jgi:hypothetical protein